MSLAEVDERGRANDCEQRTDRDGHRAVVQVADQARICQPEGTVPGLQFAATGGQDVAVRAGDA
jgi:hypothetical protein